MAVDLRSVAFSAQAATQIMERSGNGSIINIASVMAWYTFPDYSAYTASKARLIGLTKTLALELGPLGIRVNAIAPGFIDTGAWERVIAGMENAGHTPPRFPGSTHWVGGENPPTSRRRWPSWPVRMQVLLPATLWSWTAA